MHTLTTLAAAVAAPDATGILANVNGKVVAVGVLILMVGGLLTAWGIIGKKENRSASKATDASLAFGIAFGIIAMALLAQPILTFLQAVVGWAVA